jgi:hypothetical protein
MPRKIWKAKYSKIKSLGGELMEENSKRIFETIRKMETHQSLERLEANILRLGALTDDVEQALKDQYKLIGRALVAARTGLDLSNLSVPEEKIVLAVSEYVGLQKRNGKNSQRTLEQLKNRGLIGAAEVSVMKSKPTQGFEVLHDADKEELSYERIILDHPDYFTPRAIWYARNTLELGNSTEKPPAAADNPTQGRCELLISWLSDRSTQNEGAIPAFTNDEAASAVGMDDMQRFGRVQGNIQSRVDFACYACGLPPLGLTAENPFPDAWSQQERSWAFPISDMQKAAKQRIWKTSDFDSIRKKTLELPAGASGIWKQELAENEQSVRDWALGFGDLNAFDGSVETKPTHTLSSPYWIFVCNPKKWAIDRFLEQKIEIDSWGVREADVPKIAQGQLGYIRVGVDRRTEIERDGRAKLDAGIYALVEVVSEPYEAAGADAEFWADGEKPVTGRPTVKIRYLQTFPDILVTIEDLRRRAPGISKLVLDGFQARSFPIPSEDFHAIAAQLNLGERNVDQRAVPKDDLDVDVSELEKRYLNAAPEVKERTSRYIERGTVGETVKKANEYKCQICDALGKNPLGFRKPNGVAYVEAHHVMPVSKLQIGSLNASNIMTVCANHHRQLHYGGIVVQIEEKTFDLVIDQSQVRIPRLRHPSIRVG